MNTTAGITLDTGALIALERGQKRMRELVDRARSNRVPVTVPAVVLIEWWRAGFGHRHRDLLEPMVIEPTNERIARAAGEALTTIEVSVVDAAVMASAALRGDVVVTSDMTDLGRLQVLFPGVRLFGI